MCSYYTIKMVNNNDTDQTAHLCSLISVFVVLINHAFYWCAKFITMYSIMGVPMCTQLCISVQLGAASIGFFSYVFFIFGRKMQLKVLS